MKRMLLTTAAAGVLVLLCVSLSGVAYAGSLSNARVALRVGPYVPASKACLETNTGVATDCVDWDNQVNDPTNTNGSTANYYLIVGQAATGVGGLSLGLDYTNLFVTFTSCTDGLEFTNNGWPASGGGNRITWTSCPAPAGLQATTPSGIQVVFGAFYVYKYGVDTQFKIAKNQLSPGTEDDELVVGDCGAAESPLSILAGAIVGVGSAEGYNPCGKIPTENTTWGELKGRFGSE
jgi:hypothetical protein